VKKTLFFLITLVLVTWVQLAGNLFMGTSGLGANFVLVIVLYMGLAKGPLAGEMMGFFWGLLVDASSLGLMGLHAVLYAAVGFLAGMLRRQLDENKVWTQTIFTLIVSVFYGVFYFTLDRIFSPGPHPVSWGLLLQPFINSLVAPIVFWVMRRWSQLWDFIPQEE
jgi:rod shape-determining protein MreD